MTSLATGHGCATVHDLRPRLRASQPGASRDALGAGQAGAKVFELAVARRHGWRRGTDFDPSPKGTAA
jgi:hypothetical protein